MRNNIAPASPPGVRHAAYNSNMYFRGKSPRRACGSARRERGKASAATSSGILAGILPYRRNPSPAGRRRVYPHAGRTQAKPSPKPERASYFCLSKKFHRRTEHADVEIALDIFVKSVPDALGMSHFAENSAVRRCDALDRTNGAVGIEMHVICCLLYTSDAADD